MTWAVATNFALGARVRIFTIPGRRGRMGRVGTSVGAAHLDLRKRQDDSAGKERFYGERGISDVCIGCSFRGR